MPVERRGESCIRPLTGRAITRIAPTVGATGKGDHKDRPYGRCNGEGRSQGSPLGLRWSLDARGGIGDGRADWRGDVYLAVA